MKKILQVFALLLVLSVFASEEPLLTRTWVPGVAKGDYFIYEMYGVYTSNRPNATIKVPPFENNNTDWVRINVTEVSGSIVYQLYTIRFKNGTDYNFNLKTDLNPENARSMKFSDKGVPICAANLNIGDTLPTAQLTINQTIIRAYQSGLRETNQASWNIPEDWGHCYFDKKTGMLIELFRIHKFTNQATGETIEKADVINLVRSNKWDLKASPLTTAPLFMLVTLIIFALLALSIITPKYVSKKRRLL